VSPVTTGIGWDTHRLVEGRALVLGGVAFPDAPRGLAGHSDADVLTHAVIDALLGAAGLGDIGQHFPDSDPAWEGADSIELLRHVVGLLGPREVLHVDTTLLLEAPRLGERREEIRTTLAGALGVTATRVNVKATTGEGMGPVGRGEGVVALAVATLRAPG
jgi:2-C-methyl-D-erythritol 2,4-cyclodiphosphate synthase